MEREVGSGCRHNAGPALVIISSLVPDAEEFHGPAFNRAGQMFQRGLVAGLATAGLSPGRVFSMEPIPVFPRGRRLLGRMGRHVVESGHTVRFLPFLNVGPFKAVTVGLSVFAAIVGWAWRNRGRQRVVHIFNLTMPPGLFVWLAARLTRSHAVVSVLDVWKPGGVVPDVWQRRMDFRMQRWLLPRFDGHSVVSHAIADDLIPGRAVCLIEGGIAAERPESREPSPRLTTDAFRIVLMGSLEAYNGVDLALAAMARLPEGFELVVAGAGTLAGSVRASAATNPKIVYRGFLSTPDVIELCESADLLLNIRLTTAMDTRYFFPSKLMELLVSGTPVISTCTGHVERGYGHLLYLLRDESAESLTERIQDISRLPSEERVALAMRARQFMLAEMTWNRQGARFAHYIRNDVLGAT